MSSDRDYEPRPSTREKQIIGRVVLVFGHALAARNGFKGLNPMADDVLAGHLTK